MNCNTCNARWINENPCDTCPVTLAKEAAESKKFNASLASIQASRQRLKALMSR